ncbi:MAG: hypothetical protein FWG65_03660, partial [Turicibacter sp.]|nr:hypothetical protein [Turicibacter sp.]
MTNQPKNTPTPTTEPKPPKHRKLIFAIIAILSAFFAVPAIIWYDYHFGETVARIEINGSNVDLTSRGIDSYLSEDGSYI